MDSGKRPAEDAVDPSPSALPPLGALSPLPEVLLAHLCSFLSGRDLARLGGACAALHESPVSLWPRLRVGLHKDWRRREPENEEERWQAVRMLARRAANGLEELRMEKKAVSGDFFSAVRAAGQPLQQLTSLHATLYEPESMVSVGGVQHALAEVLAAGQLPMLRELHLLTEYVESMGPVCRMLSKGACPRLERIKVEGGNSQQLVELAEAMRARSEGCEGLRAVCLTLNAAGREGKQATCGAVKALLSRLSPRSLEELCLECLPPESLQGAVIPALASDCAALTTLKLDFEDTASVDGLLHTLARGAMPSLTSLDVTDGTCSDEAWRALGEAMGSEGTCLRRIKTLKLDKVIQGRRQLAILCRAMGSGHGCPELEVMDISSNSSPGACGTALAPAFRPPHGLPRLKELLLEYMNLRNLDQLVEALQHRPHASQPMEVIKMTGDGLFESARGLGEAMAEGGALAGLKELSMSSFVTGPEEWSMQLVEALAGGAGQQLEEIDCGADGLSTDLVDRLLRGLAIQRAYPRLRRLSLGRASGTATVIAGHLDACSLSTILAGRAACSNTLRELRLYSSELSHEGLRRVAACLREPQAIQLESLELRAGEPDACEAVMELLSALGGWAGGRLRNLTIWLRGCQDDDVKRVVEHVVGIIKGGGLPAIGPAPSIIRAGKNTRVGEEEMRGALQERAQARWLASW